MEPWWNSLAVWRCALANMTGPRWGLVEGNLDLSSIGRWPLGERAGAVNRNHSIACTRSPNCKFAGSGTRALNEIAGISDSA